MSLKVLSLEEADGGTDAVGLAIGMAGLGEGYREFITLFRLLCLCSKFSIIKYYLNN